MVLSEPMCQAFGSHPWTTWGGGAVMGSRNMDTAKAEDVTIDLVRVDLVVASHHVHISLTSFQALLIHIHGSIS